MLRPINLLGYAWSLDPISIVDRAALFDLRADIPGIHFWEPSEIIIPNLFPGRIFQEKLNMVPMDAL
jgi:hypothetical protein